MDIHDVINIYLDFTYICLSFFNFISDSKRKIYTPKKNLVRPPSTKVNKFVSQLRTIQRPSVLGKSCLSTDRLTDTDAHTIVYFFPCIRWFRGAPPPPVDKVSEQENADSDMNNDSRRHSHAGRVVIF